MYIYIHISHTRIPCQKSRTRRTMRPLCREEAFDRKLCGRIPAYSSIKHIVCVQCMHVYKQTASACALKAAML